jgi:hypothetical protein
MPLDAIKETSSGDYDKADVERYIAELMSDFSRVKSVMQRNVDEARAEKERLDQEKEQLLFDRDALSNDREAYATKSEELEQKVQEFEGVLAEMARLQEDLGKVEDERTALAAKLGEIEGKNIQSSEDLLVVLEEKQEIEDQNQMLQFAYEEALEKIRLLTQEKESAILSESEAKELLSEQSKQFDDLAAELDSLKSINERLEEELDKGYDPDQTPEYVRTDYVDDFEPGETSGSTELALSSEFSNKYGSDLITDSGMELFRMLKGMVDEGNSDDGVRLTRAWEEETEETIPSEDPEGPSIIKKVRKRSEVSVEYINGPK